MSELNEKQLGYSDHSWCYQRPMEEIAIGT